MSGCLGAKSYGLLLAGCGWRRSVLAEQTVHPHTMAKNSVGDHESGFAARVVGEANFLQARSRMSRSYVPLVSCVISQDAEDQFP